MEFTVETFQFLSCSKLVSIFPVQYLIQEVSYFGCSLNNKFVQQKIPFWNLPSHISLLVRVARAPICRTQNILITPPHGPARSILTSYKKDNIFQNGIYCRRLIVSFLYNIPFRRCHRQ